MLTRKRFPATALILICVIVSSAGILCAENLFALKKVQHAETVVRGNIKAGKNGSVYIITNPKSRSRIIFVVEGETFGLEKMDGKVVAVRGVVIPTGNPYRKKLIIKAVPRSVKETVNADDNDSR